MKLRINTTIKIYDEYIYKILFVVFGVLSWVYGLSPFINHILKAVIIISIFPIAINFIKLKKNDFRWGLSLLTLLLGLATIAFCTNRRATMITLTIAVIQMIVLGYCSPQKKEQQLEHELITIFKAIAIIGTILLVISLRTYFSGISIAYVYSSDPDATTLYVGRSAGRGGLTGILANENMISNLCVIYLGSVLCLVERSKHKLIGIILVVMDIYIQYLTSSRGGLIGTVVILGMFFWFKYKQYMSYSYFNKFLRVFSIFLVILCFSLYIVFGGHFNIFGVLNRTQAETVRSTQIRLYLWSAALQSITSSFKNFMLGIGHGISDTMASYSEAVLSRRFYSNVHNAYLQKAVEFGVPAALIMITYFGIMLTSGIRYIKRTLQGNLIMQILTAMVIALLINNLVESDMLSRGFEGTLIWIYAGYLYAIAKKKRESMV